MDQKTTPDFRTVSESIEDLDLAELEHFIDIPDYLEPTKLAYPLVVESSAGAFCLEGWALVERVKSEGKMRLPCHIHRIRDHSAIELALRKVSMRTAPQGGKAMYSELVRNTQFLLKILSQCLEDPIIFSHGGARKGEKFSTNREENLRLVLAERLGKSVTTISKYVNHGEYLDEETLQKLVVLKAEKSFYEAAQTRKRVIIKNLRHEGRTDGEITIRLSQEIMDMLAEYRKTKEIPAFRLEELAGEDQEESKKQTDQDVSEQLELFSHWTGNKGDVGSSRITRESINAEVEGVAERLIEIAHDQEGDLDRSILNIRAEIARLSKIHGDLVFMKKQADFRSTKKAA